MLPVAAERILLTRGRAGLVRSAAVFASVCLAIFSYFVATSFGGLGFSYWTQASRDLHGESLPGSILLALGHHGRLRSHDRPRRSWVTRPRGAASLGARDADDGRGRRDDRVGLVRLSSILRSDAVFVTSLTAAASRSSPSPR